MWSYLLSATVKNVVHVFDSQCVKWRIEQATSINPVGNQKFVYSSISH